MVSGKIRCLAQNFEKEGGNDDRVDDRLVDVGNTTPKTNSKFTLEVLSTGASREALAKEEKTGLKLYMDTVKAEQRSKFLNRMSIIGVGTNRIEFNRAKSRQEKATDTNDQR